MPVELDEIRARYAAAALSAAGASADGGGERCCGSEATSPGAEDVFGGALYPMPVLGELPAGVAGASLGCGVPTEVAALRAGEVVLDLGSGAGLDVLLSARRVGPDGHAYGLDVTAEMLAVARRNQAEAGVGNVTFLLGRMEDVPLPDDAVDVVISNCVVNLSLDKPAVFRELARVVRPGGRLAISDVLAEDHLTPAERAERGSHVGCIAGALSEAEVVAGLEAVGFAGVTVERTHRVADGMHAAVLRAVRAADR
ncbi:MAG: methyltransferase domain-containing protein [Nitriliruptoraceae bacterium]